MLYFRTNKVSIKKKIGLIFTFVIKRRLGLRVCKVLLILLVVVYAASHIIHIKSCSNINPK